MKKGIRMVVGVVTVLAGTFIVVALVIFLIWLFTGDTGAYSRGG